MSNLDTLSLLRAASHRQQERQLPPLRLDDVAQPVCEALRAELDSAHPLVRLLHEMTDGNPFLAIQFLSALADEGLLALDKDTAVWGHTHNVVHLMVAKLKRLPDTAQTAIQQLAGLGNVVEISTLSLVFGKSEREIHTSRLAW